MKLRFEPNLDYQLEAIRAVGDLFRGQEARYSQFAVTGGPVQPRFSLAEGAGIGNRLDLADDDMLRNLRSVQLRNGLLPDEALRSRDFTVEMETGTGKTYVYLRTVFALNRRYGFTKFVVVVPSVAIKEGVAKALQITDSHFRSLYRGAAFDWFLYDSVKLGLVRNFATGSHIQIMVATVGAINKKDFNNLYKDSEKAGGTKPIDLIRATRPILIVDEPQSVDGGLGGRGREALARMDPLCTLRYSATHADRHHMVYRLDAVDAYQRGLVKRIEVASAVVESAHNRPYLRLIATARKAGTISARVEIDIERAGRVRRVRKTVQDGDDLEEATGRAVYRGCRIGEISVAKGGEFVELRVPGGERWLRPGEAWGDIDGDAARRQMIRRTVREHLDKEKRLRPKGIKVLSLFFIDAVERYRRYDDEGRASKGVYARMFEEEYRRLAGHPRYRDHIQGLNGGDAEEAHDGYFSIDRKGGWTDTAEGNQAGRDNAERAYNLIMKEKERLLSLDTPLRFIFSHSALREGWDNPNVFQICTLRDIRSERERRQTVGRGLRLAVNRKGERLHSLDVNTLTVIATESYEEFAANLQKEIERDTAIRFGIVEAHAFAAIPAAGVGGRTQALGIEASKTLWEHLLAMGYIDSEGRIRDTLRVALREKTLNLPARFRALHTEIAEALHKRAGQLDVRNADERRTVHPRQAVLDSQEFRDLWDSIKHRTTYRVAFDGEALIGRCARALADMPAIPKARLQWRKADIAIAEAGVEATETAVATPMALDEAGVELPDLIAELQNRTQLTRDSVLRILCESGRLAEIGRNPQRFVEHAAETIAWHKRTALVDGIRYRRLGSRNVYAQELFEKEELVAYLKNMIEAKKSVYEQVVYESGVEAEFADRMERNDDVKVYAKLPGWFTVPTPLGRYNPDWAILIDSEEGEQLYLVVETKGSEARGDLRDAENAKIACGKAHFDALAKKGSPARYHVATGLDDLLSRIGAGG